MCAYGSESRVRFENSTNGDGQDNMRARGARGTRDGVAAAQAVTVAVLIGAMLGAVGVVAPAASVPYPTWDEVQEAKSNEESAQSAANAITSLISNLNSEVAAAEEGARQSGAEYQKATDDFDEADYRLNQFEQQVTASAKVSENTKRNVGGLAARLYRASGFDFLLPTLLLHRTGEKPDRLLDDLGRTSKLTESFGTSLRSARAAVNTTKSLAAHAEVARSKREFLKNETQDKHEKAVAMQDVLAAKVAEQTSKGAELEQQLKALQDKTTAVVAGYRDGQAIRIQREAAAAAAVAASASASLSNDSGSVVRGTPGPALGGGYVSGGGWAVPVSGNITDGFGPRRPVCVEGGCSGSMHRGTDLGARCGAPLYAAHSGTVTFAGWSGSYGNFIQIDHGEGITTGYAHLRPGGIFVSSGQNVSVGENIGSVGSTGVSEGCHLHYEVRIGGSAVDAVPFMAERGAPLG